MPAAPTTAVREEPPACPYDNRRPDTRHPDGLTCRNCPTHLARKLWTQNVRRDRIRSGAEPPRPRSGRTLPRNPELRRPVPKCGLRHASRQEKNACERCKRRGVYVNARRRDEIARGYTLVGVVDAAPVKKYVTEVLLPSGRRYKDIVELSGVGSHVIAAVVRKDQQRIMKINAQAILSVPPADNPCPPPAGMVDAVAVRRILRGLHAQGWTAGYMASLEGMTESNLCQLANGKVTRGHPRRFVRTEVLNMAKRLAAKLGPFDIAQLETPLDGMSAITAHRAAKRGWLPLDAWDGLDVTDPTVKPHGYDALDDRLLGYVLVEPQKIEIALDASCMRAGLPFAVPFTYYELRQFVHCGSLPGPTGEPRYSASQIAERANITERTVNRIRAELGVFHDVVASGVTVPVAAVAAACILTDPTISPDVRLEAARRILAPFPIGRRSFYRHFFTLMLIHPEPYGLGWTDTELAAWLGVTTERAEQLRGAAVTAGRQYYEARNGMPGRPCSGVFDLPAAA